MDALADPILARFRAALDKICARGLNGWSCSARTGRRTPSWRQSKVRLGYPSNSLSGSNTKRATASVPAATTIPRFMHQGAQADENSLAYGAPPPRAGVSPNHANNKEFAVLS